MSNKYEGFYKTKHTGKTGKPSVFLALMPGTEKTDEQLKTQKIANLQCQSTQPHLGAKASYEPLADIQRRGIKITPDEAKKLWIDHYESSLKSCSHVFWSGACAIKNTGFECDVSRLQRTIIFFRKIQFAAKNWFESLNDFCE